MRARAAGGRKCEVKTARPYVTLLAVALVIALMPARGHDARHNALTTTAAGPGSAGGENSADPPGSDAVEATSADGATAPPRPSVAPSRRQVRRGQPLPPRPLRAPRSR